MAVGIDEGEEVGALFGDNLELVLAVGGFSEVGAVEVPVEGGVGVAVGGGEDDALAPGVKGDRGGDAHPFLRIDDLDGAGCP